MNSLREAFEAVEDYRQWHKYDLAGILTFLCLAMMCGCNGERERSRGGDKRSAGACQSDWGLRAIECRVWARFSGWCASSMGNGLPR
jgi:hypothetical protein